MKAKELRIGNWVNWKGSEVQLETSDFGQLYFDSHYLDISEGIPLTTEWLERFGFEKPAISWIGDKFHLTEFGERSKYPKGGVWCVAMNKNNAVLTMNLKYVHQLQNLYYALSGEEL